MVFKNARRMNVSISKEKLQIGKKVSFAGYTVDGAGVHADETKTKAIREFPTPKTVKDVRSFLGLANQLGNFVPNLAMITSPIRELLKGKSKKKMVLKEKRKTEISYGLENMKWHFKIQNDYCCHL